MGLIKPTKGSVKLRGLDSSTPESREGVGYLPENPAFYDELTPQETLELLGALAGVPGRARAKEAARQLARVGMSHAAHRPLRSLSKGMHQRVGIAQALLNQPQLIILDEPLSGLDPIGRREIRDVLLEERARGASLMLSSHILPDVEALCDRFAVMHEGRVRHEAPMSSLWAHVSNVELSLGEASEALKEALLSLEGARTQRPDEGLHKGVWGLTLPQAQQEQALALIAEHRGGLRHLQPVRPTLDDLFERLARGEEVSA
jgi:ABC-2 type transport system ATP-binding protein